MTNMDISGIKNEIIEQFAHAIVIVDSNGIVFYSNREAKRSPLFKIKLPIGKQLHKVLHPSCPAKSILSDALKKKKCQHNFNFSVTGENKKWISATSLAIKVPGIKTTAIAFTFKDISDTIFLKSELKKQIELLDNIFNACPYPFAVIDSETLNVIMANNAGIESGLVVNEPCLSYHDTEKSCIRGEGHCPVIFVKNKGVPVTMEHIHKNKNGRPIIVEIHASPMSSPEGKPKHVILSYIDITDQKKAIESSQIAHERFIREQLALQSKNIALKEILNKIDEEKSKIRNNISSNIDSIIMPIIESLYICSDNKDRAYLQLLRESLNDIASPFISKLEEHYKKLTPREIEIANFIKRGMSSKEIAFTINISLETVNWYRKNIRKKLGISKKRMALSSFLKGL